MNTARIAAVVVAPGAAQPPTVELPVAPSDIEPGRPAKPDAAVDIVRYAVAGLPTSQK
jgi:hypothetical protein